MKLSDLVKQVISEIKDSDFTMKEDTWGNNPSAGGSMSPGRSPTATPPSPTANTKSIDILDRFKNFKSQLIQQETTSAKKLAEELKNMFLKKTITVSASKGSIGQIEKEYKITVNNIGVRYMKEKYYVVFHGNEDGSKENEYYLTDSVIVVDNSAIPVSSTGTTGGLESPDLSTGNTKRNIIPQK
jgi:hypothetical protein